VLASWRFDALAKGQLSSSTSYTGGNAYTRTVTGYDDGYRPLGETVTVLVGKGGLAGEYTTAFAYNVDGSVDRQSRPGGLPLQGTVAELRRSRARVRVIGVGIGSTPKLVWARAEIERLRAEADRLAAREWVGTTFTS
jgi:hypothetical protein